MSKPNQDDIFTAEDHLLLKAFLEAGAFACGHLAHIRSNHIPDMRELDITKTPHKEFMEIMGLVFSIGHFFTEMAKGDSNTSEVMDIIRPDLIDAVNKHKWKISCCLLL